MRALVGDGFERVDDADSLVAGDIVVYQISDQIDHVAVVTGALHEITNELLVLSKFGSFGEYIHVIDDVPDELGRPASFWKKRFSYECFLRAS